MALHTLQSGALRVIISDAGAEIIQIEDILTGRNYLWHGDSAYWGRRSPILFPIVGGLKNKTYKYAGREYPMSQHGFARDREFQMTEHNVDTIWFELKADEESLKVYPFRFRLEIGYRLEGRKITVMWRVANEDKKTMFFSIGGHPAFMCPIDGEGKQTDYYLLFDNKEPLSYGKLSVNGLLETEGHTLDIGGGCMPITEHMFDEDALVIEGGQAHQVALAGPDKKPYLTVKFDAPLFGLWSPAKKHAPFVCIEPWYGRCDRESFAGMLADREYGNELRPGKIFETEYTIIAE
ncbi:putative mutarotase [Clostridium sp. CAG:632]|nr:aldose 1-epimerase family protein [Clostridium sp.]CCY58412.1 putative mutarotase [Clostridium sp. CAG:632]